MKIYKRLRVKEYYFLNPKGKFEKGKNLIISSKGIIKPIIDIQFPNPKQFTYKKWETFDIPKDENGNFIKATHIIEDKLGINKRRFFIQPNFFQDFKLNIWTGKSWLNLAQNKWSVFTFIVSTIIAISGIIISNCINRSKLSDFQKKLETMQVQYDSLNSKVRILPGSLNLDSIQLKNMKTDKKIDSFSSK